MSPIALIAFPGMGELVMILVIVLVLFGAPKLPQTAASLGKAIHNFRKAMSGQDSIDVTPPDSLEGGEGSREATPVHADEVGAPRR